MKAKNNSKSGFLELKFSDLNEDEQEKYMEFLVQNNIFFEEEKENNNFIATIKFLQASEKKNNDGVKNKKKDIKNHQFTTAFTMARSSNRVIKNENSKKQQRKELTEIQNINGKLFL